MQLSPKALQFLQIAQTFIAPHNLTTPTVTLNQVVKENDACSSGQEDTKQGYKAYTGKNLESNYPLTLGMAEISSPNYGLDWVWSNRSEWREEPVRRALQAMVRVIVQASLEFLSGDDKAALAAKIGDYLDISAKYVAGDMSRSTLTTRLKELPARSGGSEHLRYLPDLLACGIDGHPAGHVYFFNRLLDVSGEEARHVAGAILMLLNGEHYEVPAMPVVSGSRLRLGQLVYELTFDGTTPIMTLIPYRLPAGGERWLDEKGGEYLILEGAAQAVELKSGNLFPLVDGALPERVRGIGFTFKG